MEDEQQGSRKAAYDKAVLADLARRLTAEYGGGYDESNLRNMRSFYLAFPIRDALRHELNWTHHRPFQKELYRLQMAEATVAEETPFAHLEAAS